MVNPLEHIRQRPQLISKKYGNNFLNQKSNEEQKQTRDSEKSV